MTYAINYNTLPDVNNHKTKFFKDKHSNEDLGIAEIPLSTIDFVPNNDTFLIFISAYLSKGINLKVTKDTFLNYSSSKYVKYQYLIENYTKAVWLTGIFLNEGFKNLMGAHWNPKINKWQIHPGGTRQTVLRMFTKKDHAEFLAFNTGGVKTQFKNVFKSYKSLTDYFTDKQDIFLCLTADHGSLIPHVHFDQHNLKLAGRGAGGYIKAIKKFYKNTHIEFTNFDPSTVNYNPPKKAKNYRKVTLDDPTDQSNIIRAFLLLPNFETFNDYGVKIECT